MKIKRNGEAHTEIERMRQQVKNNAEQSKKGGAATDVLARRQQGDTVSVSIAKDIASIAQSRADKVAELKALVESGQYNPDSRLVAGAIDEAISEEVVFDKIENI